MSALTDPEHTDRRPVRKLVDDALDAIERRDGEIHAFVDVFADEARGRADQLDADATARGALRGVTLSVKDLFAVAGSTTHAGSRAFSRADDHGSTAVARLRAADAVILGRTAMHEFAMGVTTPGVNNPLDPTRSAGGSSGGAAAALAAGMGTAALGSDTRGSIRIPAAFCGVVGLKPTYGAVPLDDAVPLSWSLDHAGPLADSVATASAVFRILGDHSVATGAALAPGSPPPLGEQPRVGLPPAAWRDVEPAVAEGLAQAVGALDATGVAFSEAEHPSAEDFDSANEVSVVISRSEAVAFHRSLGLDRALYSDEVRAQLAAAESTLAADYVDAQRLRETMRGRLVDVFGQFDLLLMPTVPIVAPPHEGALKLSRLITRNTAIWNFVGFPALSVPSRAPEQRLPAGVQIVGPPGAEEAVLELGGQLERALR